MIRRLIGLSVAVALLALALMTLAPAARAEFPYVSQGSNPDDYTDLYLTDEEPNDVGDADSGEYFKYAASPDPANTINNARSTELRGVRGASLFDFDESLDWAWQVSSGRPDVTIATIDSGIKWNDDGAMNDLRFKTRINGGEVPTPRNDGLPTPNEPGENCSAAGPYDETSAGLDGDDLNGDGVFNILDFACDGRVSPSPTHNVNPDLFEPQDVLIAFSNGDDADANGFVDDMVGWDFLDDDNDPFDDVQYGHGTGEAEGSSGEANNGSTIGSCPNCMVIHMRAGDSFIADVNRFAAAVVYAVDNGALVVQSALGTLNNSSFARDAVEYAYEHGVTSIVSAADEAAQHNNQPYLPKTILVNSVTRRSADDGAPPGDQSYLAFNGCTNFNAKVTLAIPSTSCSSDAVGVASGLAGIIYSAALNAHEQGALDEHPDCERAVDGPDAGTALDPCVITPNEVRQLMASGTIDGQTMPDDVNFASPLGTPEPSCTPPVPGCTHPYGAPGTIAGGAVQTQVDANRSPLPAPIAALRSYPARKGHDQFYGYGRVNINRSVRALLEDPAASTPEPALIPPEAELESPTWNEQVDPDQATVEVTGQVWARGEQYSCQVYVAPGHYPNNALVADGGDFAPVDAGEGGACDGTTRTAKADGKLAEIEIAEVKARFPPGTDFSGPEPVPTTVNGNGRPNGDPHGFVVKVVATRPAAGGGAPAMTGEDQRAAYLLRDQDMLAGFPRTIGPGGEVDEYGLPTSDGASSPAFADLDGDNRNELIFATSDGFVHALRPDGTELPGWPVRGDVPGFVADHADTRAFDSGEVSSQIGGAMLSSVAVADSDRDGIPEVYVADLEGKVYGWSAGGQRTFTEETNIDYSGKPLEPFENVRYEPGQSEYRRTQHGFIASPVLADVDRDDGGKLEIVAAAMDRHLYAWETDDSNPGAPGGAEQLDGYPVLVVDPAKVESVDSVTHAVTFKPDAESKQQGAIVDTPAVGDLDADEDEEGDDELPEIVLGTNEEYVEPINAANFNTATFPLIGQTGLLEPGNSRLYALEAGGDRDRDVLLDDSTLREGWPFAIGIATTGLLPVVGEGVTGNPVIGPVSCPPQGAAGDTGPNIGALANNGPAYILNQDASSCYGEDPTASDRPIALASDVGANPLQVDHPVLPAVGHPAFGAQPTGLAFFAPAAGVTRALDLALPEYQPTGQDFLAGWSTSTSQFQQGFPTTVNDLQFLTGPAIADLDGLPGEEIVEGTASKDLAAFNAAGTPYDPTRWPKASTDWTVATPLIGSFGTRDTDAGAGKVVIGMTRSGYINAYSTAAPACSPSSSPRFHHDNANSGDYRRDAVLPGRPFETAIEGATIELTAPGDDLLCGTAAAYEIVSSDRPIDESSFGEAEPLPDPPQPAEAGSRQSFTVGLEAERYVAIRAVDEQGNVGRVALLDFGGDPPAPPDEDDDGIPDSHDACPNTPGSGPDGCPPKPSAGGGGAAGPTERSRCHGERVEKISGTKQKDKLLGTRRNDKISGRKGKDKIKGRGGDDCLKGQGDRDRMKGNNGRDELRGGGDRDILKGNGGRDRLRGGRKADRLNGGGGKDKITDRSGGKDRLAGGGGRDKIKANKGAPDKVDCGPGRDKAIVDRRDRIKRCEKVTVR